MIPSIYIACPCGDHQTVPTTIALSTVVTIRENYRTETDTTGYFELELVYFMYYM